MKPEEPFSTTVELEIPSDDYLVFKSLRHWPNAAPLEESSELESLNQDAIDNVFAVAEGWRLAHVFRYVHRECAVLEGSRPFSLYPLVAREVRELQMDAWQELADSLEDSNIELLLPKGSPQFTRFYPADCPVLSSDLDIMVPRPQIHLVAQILRSLGYSQSYTVQDGEGIRLKDGVLDDLNYGTEHFGQLWPFARLESLKELREMATELRTWFPDRDFVTRDDSAFAMVSVDLHYSLNILADRNNINGRVPYREFWSRTQGIALRGRRVTAIAPDALGWIIPYHFYADTMFGCDVTMKPLADLLLLGRTGHLDYQSILDAASAYESLRPGIFYVYHFLHSFAGLELPAGFLAELPVNVDRPGCDFGHFLPRLLRHRPTFMLREA